MALGQTKRISETNANFIKVWSMDTKNPVYSLKADAHCRNLVWFPIGKVVGQSDANEISKQPNLIAWSIIHPLKLIEKFNFVFLY